MCFSFDRGLPGLCIVLYLLDLSCYLQTIAKSRWIFILGSDYHISVAFWMVGLKVANLLL